MNNTADFSGIHIPLVTPFTSTGELDEKALRTLVDYCITEQQADGLMPCGTTGEVPALTFEEHKRVVTIVVNQAKGRVPVIPGTGSNNTAHAIELTRFAEQAGCAACLQVTPYYSKPSQDGIVAHFKAIAAGSNLPMILYNIPGRTARNVEPATILRMAKEISTIVGVKDAACDIVQTEALLQGAASLGRPFVVLTGEDRMTFLNMCLGGHGAVSAVCHIVGKEYQEMLRLLREQPTGYLEAARVIHYKTLPVVAALFSEPNPAPTKAALHLMGVLPDDSLRLPLLSMTDVGKEKLKAELKVLGKVKG
ncbi:4-hydroxy-tetrahydrodipicolinate synthase [Candidatus Woesearchaeota archaeon CG1_02_57_44]|nr:MAG: 4-hydroxy-tetrahydrodipicolinate synthase [Candidatus Woesearchaeota archaeon CG1_02_57_44]